MTWILALVWVVGTLLFVFTVWMTALVVMRMTSGRRRDPGGSGTEVPPFPGPGSARITS